MKNNRKSVSELATLVGGEIVGDGDILVDHVASLERAGEGAVAFIEDERTINRAEGCKASCLIVSKKISITFNSIIAVNHPKLAFALIAQHLHPKKRNDPSIDPTAIIHLNTKIDPTAFIGAYAEIGSDTTIGTHTEIHQAVSIGENVRIGSNCTIYPHVVIYDNVTIEDNVILHAGSIIGADGFGYVRSKQGYEKFPQLGTVIIEKDVEIGANTCIDRGALGTTRIGEGTKIDNLVQIGHNVEIGKRVVIAAQTGISGSTIIEDDAVIGGQVGMGDHARVERGAIIGSKAGILPGKIVRKGSVMWGVPVRPLDEYKRLNAYFGKLPQMHDEIKELKEQLKEILTKIETMDSKD
jgi:UDP-3-O-[3-hydroxymyristoyl] glucosamine N-acyltransferase